MLLEKQIIIGKWDMHLKIVLIFAILMFVGSASATSYESIWSYKIGTNVNSVSVSSDGSYIAAGSFGGGVYFFNREGRLLWSYKTGNVNSVSVSSDGSYIAAGSGIKVYFFDKMGNQLWNRSTIFDTFSVSVSSNGSYIVAGSGRSPNACEISYYKDCGYYAPYDNIYFFNKEGELLWNREGRFRFISVSMSSTGSYVTAASSDDYSKYYLNGVEYPYKDDRVYLFDLKGKLLWYLRIDEVIEKISYSNNEVYRFGKKVNSVSLSSDGSYISAGSVNNNVYLLNQKGQVVWSYEIGTNVNSVSISSDGSYIAAGSFGGNVYFFAETNTPKFTPTSTPVNSPTITITPKYATLTVDDSGGAEYKKIQDAVNAASDGDTILVYSGTYYENVNVNKQLVLRGIDNGGGKPVVDAGGGSYAITLSVGKSTLEGFTAVNAGNLYELAKEFKSAREGGVEGIKLKNVRGDAGIRVASNNNIIRNNTASNNEEGIRVWKASNNMLSDNTASNNYLSIYLHDSNNNTVSGNTVLNDIANNIYLWYSNKNIITGNNVGNIVIDQSSNYNILYQNNLINAHDGGHNQWDNGINMGNYWSDYKGTDANNDGIGDTPYNLSDGTMAQDRYPLMVPYGGATLPPTPIPTPTSTYMIAYSPTPTFTPTSNHPPEKSYVRLLALMPMMFLLVHYIKKFSK